MERRNPSSASSSSRVDRKTIERNRRNHMKSLFSQLNSLVPHQSSREVVPLPDQLEEAAKYIKRLQINMEKLNQKKQDLLRFKNLNSITRNTGMTSMNNSESWDPAHISVHQVGSALEVNLVGCSSYYDHHMLFNETVRILHEDGVEVISASFSVVGNNVYHTIHSEVRDSAVRSAQARISERLRDLISTGYEHRGTF